MGKIENKIAYIFFLRKLLDLIFVFLLSDTYLARADVVDAIFFALANQKAH